MNLGDGQENKEVNIGAYITTETKRDLIELLQEFKDVFAWPYQDIPSLSTDIVIKEEVKKQFDASFLQVVKYSECVANIVIVPKKDGKVLMCVDYRDLNKVSPKDNFLLPHIDTLVDNTTGVWNEKCQKTFDKVKQYLSNARVLVPPSSNKPLILYLAVFDNSMRCTTRRLRQYMLYHTTWLISELDPLKYMMESTALNGRMAQWKILLSEFDIVYVNQKAVKGSAIANFLANRALEDYEPLNFDFPNEDLMYVTTTEEDSQEGHHWKLNFDGASNAVDNRIGAVLVSPNGDHYPFTSKFDFDCTNNMAEYEACIMGIRAAIEQKIKVLEVYGDSALVIY
ncbi:RNA-directed DNA polymerase (Reverse transcriptase), Ribonuclease H [Gossypium australe]|uniref:RNA-directed DNA polymerase (Reverse transcriptase), Ribonuclease H n=1 Tax=Gossypium australe TaxID=47621 RepID=A0A5B6WIK5_9ROSI|nr:RNA-directed DNA polymerase (Reverse transcriptase), Ribonuclease H [Gossypium australe]